jgi:hypothetical protein
VVYLHDFEIFARIHRHTCGRVPGISGENSYDQLRVNVCFLTLLQLTLTEPDDERARLVAGSQPPLALLLANEAVNPSVESNYYEHFILRF